MAKVVGDIAVKVGADVGPLQRNMKRAGQSVDDFDKRAKAMALNVAKAGAAIAGAMAAATTAILAAGREAAAVGVEIKNLSAIAGVGTTEFQKYSAASRSVGIEQEKLADIFKDVNDKFGDYMATGAGPLADFFENIAPLVGVTADQFARLSGPEALQLYVSSLEQAGVSQQQMTFYMEALASDATALIPLLRNGGQAMRQLGQDAQDAGRILDEDMIASAAELDQELRDLSDTIKLSATAAILEHKEQIIALADFITNRLIPAIGGLVEWIGKGVEGWKIIGQAAKDAAVQMRDAITLQGEYGGFDPFSQGQPTQEGQQGLMDYVDGLSGGSQGTSDLTDFINSRTRNPGEASEAGRGQMPSLTDNMTLGGPLDASGGLLPPVSLSDQARAAWEERIEVEEEGAGRLVELNRETFEQLTALQQKWQGSSLDQTQTFFGESARALAQGNEKMVALSQKFAKIEALINAGRAYAQVAADPSLPWFAKIPAAIGVAAAISSFTAKSGIGGGSGSGSPSGSSASQQQAPQQEVTTFSFTLQNDPMGFGESFARQMIEQLNSAQRDGGRIQGVLA